jgi:hypothetical protein
MTDESNEQNKVMGCGGIVKGVSGEVVENVGILDLRGVPIDELTEMKSIKNAGVVLVDEVNRHALSRISMANVGGIVTTEADERVLVEPMLELSKATLEAMPSGQKLLIVGIVTFSPDIPPALVTEKFSKLRIVGILTSTAGVRGALMGCMEETIGVSVTLADDTKELIRSIGENTITNEYLTHLKDGVAYLNIGETIFADDSNQALVERKIAAYYNVGETVAPASILALVKARCQTNIGEFVESQVK